MTLGSTLIFLQARMRSSRLPGKVLLPILDRPMLYRQIERLERTKGIEKIVVLTSTHQDDDKIEDFCLSNKVAYFRGHETDVLNRFYEAAKCFCPEVIVRVTGDCPLIDSDIIESVIRYRAAHDMDYVSNALEPTFPDGLDTEVFKLTVLERAHQEARRPHEREHVTPYIYNNQDLFRVGSFKGAQVLSHLRWTVDEKEDYEFVHHIYSALYGVKPNFTTHDILNLLSMNPHLAEINGRFRRNEGLEKSLKEEKIDT